MPCAAVKYQCGWGLVPACHQWHPISKVYASVGNVLHCRLFPGVAKPQKDDLLGVVSRG